MGLFRRGSGGAYEEPSSRTACEHCGREYTATDPMVQVEIAKGEPRIRVHRACGRVVRDRRVAALRAEVTAADGRRGRALDRDDRGAYDAARADEARARQALRDLGC